MLANCFPTIFDSQLLASLTPRPQVQRRLDPLRRTVLVVPPAPDLADLALPVQLLHLLVLGVLVALAARGQHPPSKAELNAGCHTQFV